MLRRWARLSSDGRWLHSTIAVAEVALYTWYSCAMSFTAADALRFKVPIQLPTTHHIAIQRDRIRSRCGVRRGRLSCTCFGCHLSNILTASQCLNDLRYQPWTNLAL